MSISENSMTEIENRRWTFPDLKAHVIFWSFFIGGLVLDLWTKSAVFEWLGNPPRSKPIIDGFLRFVVALNDGAAFNILAGNLYFLVGVSATALLLVVGIFLFGKAHHRIIYVALGCFAAGIGGNLYDRIFNNGTVRDFINVYIRISGTEKNWPAFNVADSLLVIGVGLLIIATATAGKPDQKHVQQQK